MNLDVYPSPSGTKTNRRPISIHEGPAQDFGYADEMLGDYYHHIPQLDNITLYSSIGQPDMPFRLPPPLKTSQLIDMSATLEDGYSTYMHYNRTVPSKIQKPLMTFRNFQVENAWLSLLASQVDESELPFHSIRSAYDQIMNALQQRFAYALACFHQNLPYGTLSIAIRDIEKYRQDFEAHKYAELQTTQMRYIN